MNNFSYIVVNGSSVIAMVYENEKYGRTMIVLEKINLSHPILIYDKNQNIVSEKDFTDFIYDLIPKTP